MKKLNKGLNLPKGPTSDHLNLVSRVNAFGSYVIYYECEDNIESYRIVNVGQI